MRSIKAHILLALLVLTLGVGCTDQRNLHVTAKPMFTIKNDWSVARLQPDGATAMFFPRNNPCELMYSNANRHRLYLDRNTYKILTFNEVMFSPSTTNIEGIDYRGTDQFETFGAYVKPSPTNPIFKVGPDEIMVGYGYPEPLASAAHKGKQVLGWKEYLLKYEDGKNGFPVYKDFDADSVDMLPMRVTRDVKVVAHVKNLKGQFRVSGTLNGFAEGVLLSTRKPEGKNAAYAFDLNSAVVDPDVQGGHIIVSKPFSTLGPWWNDYPSGRKYGIEIIASKNGETFRYSFDVTENNRSSVVMSPSESSEIVVTGSVGSAIVKIRAEEAKFEADGVVPLMETIIIEIWFDLPAVVDGSIDVGVGDWGTDIIIPIPIG